MERTSHLAGGYLLCRIIDRPDYMSKALMPTRVVSASFCISGMLPDVRILFGNLEAKRKSVVELGIDPTRTSEVVAWVNTRLASRELGWCSVFFSTGLAQEFVKTFEVALKDLQILGVGLHEESLDLFYRGEDEFRRLNNIPVEDPRHSGISEMVRRGVSLEPGMPLGYEILCYDFLQSFDHSWLCNGLEADGFEKFGIRPNRHGFIDSFEDARRIAEYSSRDDVGAEPGLWLPWLIVGYSIS